MPLTASEAFKTAFLHRCVEDRLSPDQILARVKLAADILEKHAFLGGLVGAGVDAAKSVGGTALKWGLPAALAAPPIVGGLAGYALARGTDIDDTDVAEIKDREVAEEYRRQSAKLRRQKAVRDYGRQVKQTGRIFS